MKRTFNLTTYSEDLDRYRDRDDLVRAVGGFDGLELMHCGPDIRGIVPRERMHLPGAGILPMSKKRLGRTKKRSVQNGAQRDRRPERRTHLRH